MHGYALLRDMRNQLFLLRMLRMLRIGTHRYEEGSLLMNSMNQVYAMRIPLHSLY